MMVDKDIYDGLEFVRSSGLTNMFDWNEVRRLLKQFGYLVAYKWVTDNKKEYSQGIFEGFEPVDDMFSEYDTPSKVWVEVEITLTVSDTVKKMKVSGEQLDVEDILSIYANKYRDAMSYEITSYKDMEE
jgi:6-phosphogluconate dehydrogenase (decarboxylating)